MPTKPPADPRNPLDTRGKLLLKKGIDPFKYQTFDKRVDRQTRDVIVNTTVPNPRILQTTARIARDLTLVCAKPGDAELYVYGYTAVRPLVIGADDSGAYLVLDLLWSVGEINSIESNLYIPDVGSVSVAASSPTLHEHFTGTAGQSASTIMTALKGSYSAYPNKAHSVISLQDGWNLNIMGFIEGRKVLDPRASSPMSTSPITRVYSANPALCLADILVLCGYSPDWDSVAAAADYCDELVNSPGTKRWEIGGVIRDRNSLHYWVHTLAQYANCFVDEQGGNVILTPDKPRSANHTVTAADMVEGTVRVSRASARNAPDAVTVNFKSFIDRTFSKTYGTSSGSGTVTQLEMPLWTDFARAGRMAEQTYRKAQLDLSLEYVGFDDGLVRTIGDVGTITNADYGLNSQAMILVENEPVDRGRWRRRYIEYDATAYVDTDYSGTTTNDTTLYNPYRPPDGPQPTLTAELVTSTSPNYYRIKIDFSPVTWAYLQDYKVNVYIDGAPETILHSEYVAKGSETGSPETITVYADLNDSPGFQMNIGNSPQTVYRVDVYNRSQWLTQEGDEVLSATPGTATVTDPENPLAFDNLNDGAYLQRTPDSPWPFAFGDTAFTVSGWFQVPPDAASPQGVQAAIILDALGGDTTISPQDPFSGWRVSTSFTGRLRFSVMNQGNAARTAQTTGFIQPNTWYHYIAEHDPSANTVTVTVDNGAVTDTETTLGIHPDTVERDLKMANVDSGYISSPEQFQMRLDETGVWSRLLTAGEKSELWNSGNGVRYADLTSGIKSGLISWWSFDETSGQRLDSHGSYHLSLVAPSPESGTYTTSPKVT